ncbi:MAG TPA: YggS family pyridoxal phosphate-dependent enzyme [Streptosporangiaceae bacterium]|jgi:pyridoxal phosphate enzyme (YggS family)|nr:YggS family pyridoxal phosphate-dependent enzyme [Streptosporangiaceae bacterium]
MTQPQPSDATGERRDEIAAHLAEVRERIALACADAGRAVDEITMIAITKTRPASDVQLLGELGVTDIGENRDQEAAAKAAECERLGVTGLTWHFVGQLQTNKAASVVRYADVVHSVDRGRLVRALGTQARRSGRRITCLIQVSLDGDPERGGAVAEQVPGLADAVAAEDGLVLGGVMAVAPLGVAVDAAFGRLAGIAADVRAAHPGATIVSAGMSADLEDAIAAGATHLRVGTALLGARRTLVG